MVSGDILHVRVNINYISAERFWGRDEPAPPGVHISTNINIMGMESKDDKLLAPFVVTIGYTPSVAQISIKGQAQISGTRNELNQIRENYRDKKTPPPFLLQAITSTSLVEATIVSKTLNVPPPIPLPGVRPPQKQEGENPSYFG